MSISSAFLWRFLDDVWDLLPTEDRRLFETYWSAQLQVAANLEQKTIEAALSDQLSTVPIYLTERWNRYAMDDESCDLFEQTDQLLLTMTTPTPMTKNTAFYDTLAVTSSSGQILHEEVVVFFDEQPKRLRYGKIIPGMISVWNGSYEFTQNRDYAVNLQEGTIQALPDGRIPAIDSITVRYWHREYTRDLDYTVNEVAASITRTAASSIASGEVVTVSYTYNGTASIPLQGSTGSIAGSVLTDLSVNFGAVVPGQKLVVLSGVNANTYTVGAVLGATTLAVVEGFAADQETDVKYTIDAFPHGIKIPRQVVSIPVLRDLVDEPNVVLVEGVDYLIQEGILSCRVSFPLAGQGPRNERKRQMWAEVTKIDNETPYRNFGVLIDFYRKNSEAYKLALQGLWYAFWTGSTPGNLQRGLHILLGLPFAKKPGTVTRVDIDLGKIDIVTAQGQVLTYTIPAGLDPIVAVGDVVSRFDSLTTGVSIIDRNNEPGFVEARLGRAGVARFLTDKATRGAGDTDETKALKLLEHHLFIPQVLTEALVQRVNVAEIVTFLDNMKPKWTEYVFSISSDQTEGLEISESLEENDLAIDLSTTVDNNAWNQSFSFNSFVVNGTSGVILGGGSQATGNFRDLATNFTTVGIDAGDTIRITAGAFTGFYEVIKRVSIHVLSIDIPDALLQPATGIQYVAIPSERALNHDAVNLGLEHLRLEGTQFLAPSSLNAKTDADLGSLSYLVGNTEICSLLLVDIGNTGSEVQPITAADKTLNEISVADPPGVGVRSHEIASAALVRENNLLTITDAFAI